MNEPQSRKEPSVVMLNHEVSEIEVSMEDTSYVHFNRSSHKMFHEVLTERTGCSPRFIYAAALSIIGFLLPGHTLLTMILSH